MASRVVMTVVAGALPAPPRAPAAAVGGSKFVARTKRQILHRGIRCGVVRASLSCPHHPSSPHCTTVEVTANLLQTTSSKVPDFRGARHHRPDSRGAAGECDPLLAGHERAEDWGAGAAESYPGEPKHEDHTGMLGSMPAELKEKGSELYASLLEWKGGLQTLLKYIKDKDNDRLSVALASSLDTIAELELLQAPGLSFLLPKQYLDYPSRHRSRSYNCCEGA